MGNAMRASVHARGARLCAQRSAARNCYYLGCDLCRRNGRPVEQAHDGPIQIRPKCDRYGVARARDFGIFRHLRCDRAVQHAVQQCQVAATVHARMLQRGVAGAAELDAGAPPAVGGCNEHEIALEGARPFSAARWDDQTTRAVRCSSAACE